jgi:hypothetical protein
MHAMGPCFPFERVHGPRSPSYVSPSHAYHVVRGKAHSPNAFFFSIYLENCLSLKVSNRSRIEVTFLASELAPSVRAADYAIGGWNGAYRLNGLSFNKLLPVGSIN